MATKSKPVVLVVEPDYLIAEMLEGVLNDLGCDVYGPLPTTDQALAVVEEHEVDAAFLTLSMLDEHAFRLAEALAARNIPFGFATGYGEVSIPEPWKDRPYMQKPFSPEGIADFLKKMLPLHDH